MAGRIEPVGGKIRSLLRLLRRDGVEGAIRSDLINAGRSLDELGRTLSWLDFDAWLTYLPGSSAYRRLIDPLGAFSDVAPDLTLALLDEIRGLRLQLGGDASRQAEESTIDRIRRVLAARELPTAAIDTPADVIDIRSKKSSATQSRKSPPPSNIRERLARAHAAYN
ncbi:hypothetical protein R4P64_07710 [Rhodococcus sp. IEGM 1366]|uniref:hypothetical protein n=1 Tax=Rhodococcus sp. IEGM 1366 TaxID=3082223 RepID=UPI002953EFA1|nr:hypothetical protein [Rhodococcus sp. IEGM 1366]MDV8066387.1 hypothetical protein [Rhodococcus sp. IEGM 1366]